MIPTIEDLQGTWISKDFPMYQYDDNLEFTFHFGKYATLYFSKGGNNKVISEGFYTVEDMNEGYFNFIIDARMHLPLTTLNGKLYDKKNLHSFFMLVPENGWRYFQKL